MYIKGKCCIYIIMLVYPWREKMINVVKDMIWYKNRLKK